MQPRVASTESLLITRRVPTVLSYSLLFSIALNRSNKTSPLASLALKIPRDVLISLTVV